jgi:hypothetical protein
VIQAKFEDALHGRAEEYLEWLDPVGELDDADGAGDIAAGEPEGAEQERITGAAGA